jgi:hypothetical protein
MHMNSPDDRDGGGDDESPHPWGGAVGAVGGGLTEAAPGESIQTDIQAGSMGVDAGASASDGDT